MHKNLITVTVFLRGLTWKSLMDFKASELSQLGYFLFYCPFMGGHFSSVDLKIGVCIHLQEVSTYERLKT